MNEKNQFLDIAERLGPEAAESLVAKLDFYGLELEYQKKKFANPSEEYLDEQIELHQQYQVELKDERSEIIEESAEFIDKLMELNRASSALPNTVLKGVKFVARAASSAAFLYEGTTLEKGLLELVETYNSDVEDCKLSADFFEYGHMLMKESLDDNPSLTDAVEQKYDTLMRLCKDISWVSRDTTIRIEKKTKALDEFYQFLYDRPLIEN